jgi:DNA polymerase-3 subunit beta
LQKKTITRKRMVVFFSCFTRKEPFSMIITTLPAPHLTPSLPSSQPLSESEPPVGVPGATVALPEKASTQARLTCKQADLAQALHLVTNAVLPQSTLPVLNGTLLLATDQGRLRLSATTLELGIQVWIEADGEGEALTLLPAALFKTIIQTLRTRELGLALDHAQQLTLTCPGTRTVLRGGDATEYPTLPTLAGQQRSAHLEAGTLKTMIEQVVFAADKQHEQAAWRSICLSLMDTELTLAAINTFGIAERIAPVPPSAAGTLPPVLIPAQNLATLAEMLPARGTVQIQVTPQQNEIIFRWDQGIQVSVVSRLMADVFPPYRKAIPTTLTTQVITNTAELVAAVRRAAPFATSTISPTRSVKVVVQPAGAGALFGSLTVEALDGDRGESISTVLAEVTGPVQQLFFPLEKLREALCHLDAPQLELSVVGFGRPVVLRPLGEPASAGNQYLCVLQTLGSTKTTA